jgi:hypothetical protein
MSDEADDETTNDAIAGLFWRQTCAERMEMSQWLRDVLNDLVAEAPKERGLTSDDIALVLEQWADDQLQATS